ncbi:hypothetical protein Afil01_05080 [Actinorhabdospora filicis]|uniref:DUF2332 domain-containing protein n=1 Tax=Actinorhabdospora filicis TaxID=1785913 RepID=A0A9W6SJB7_9ACTN|nr:DUF2332 family protein [Actinorhabdospora filicis]GLZ75701.1 hypothetical protein Afil01_05080 [Actinorhabdospora filicis]
MTHEENDTEELTIERIFAEHAEAASETAAVYSLLCRAVADDPTLAAALDGAPAERWAKADALMTAVSAVLREDPHPLARHLPTFGGTPGPGAEVVADFTDLVRTRHEALARKTPEGTRWNDPAAAAVFHAAITRVAATDARPLALIELGSAAGLTLRPDAYGYDYGHTVVGADRPLVLSIELRGEPPAHLTTPIHVGARVGIDRAPLDVSDPAHAALLRASVRFDRAELLDRLDRAIPLTAADPPTRLTGDIVDLLPTALAETPAHLLPVIYGGNVMCCMNDRRERIPRILADSGRDAVWISQEHARNALALISESEADGYDKLDILLTAVTYRAGEIAEAAILATVGWYNAWLDWNPREVTLTA